MNTLEPRYPESWKMLYKWEGSTHRLRLLPSTVDGSPLGFTVWQHEGLLGIQSIICLRKTWPDQNYHCTLCCLVGRRTFANKSANLPYLAPYSWTYAIDRAHVQSGPQILELPPAIHEWIIEATRWRPLRGNPYGDITDLFTGRDLIIETPGPQANTYKTSFADPTPLHQDPEIVQKWISDRADILDLFSMRYAYTPSLTELLAKDVRKRLFQHLATDSATLSSRA